MEFKAGFDFGLEDDFVVTASAEVDEVAVADETEVFGDFGGVGGVEVEAVVFVVAEAGFTAVDDVVAVTYRDDVGEASGLHDVVAGAGAEVEADADGTAGRRAAATEPMKSPPAPPLMVMAWSLLTKFPSWSTVALTLSRRMLLLPERAVKRLPE